MCSCLIYNEHEPKRIYKSGGNPTPIRYDFILGPDSSQAPQSTLKNFKHLKHTFQTLMMTSGSCACRYISYTIATPPKNLVYCHCVECRKQSGAPYQTWLDFPTDSIKWNIEPTVWRSSDTATRTFCPRCGSTMTMSLDTDPSSTDVAAGTLDDESEHLVSGPGKHIFYKEKAAWFVAPDDGSKKFDGWSE